MSHKVSYKWFRRTQYIPELGLFYKNVGISLGGCLTCEDLVGEVNHTTECVTDLAKSISDCISYGFISFPFTNFTMMFPFLSR